MRTPIDRLESRLLLAYTKYDQAHKTLRIFGGEGDDRITLNARRLPSLHQGSGADDTYLDIQIDIGDVVTGSVSSEVRQIRVSLGGGDDQFIATEESADLIKRVSIAVDGGTGNDTITTASGNDVINGGSGADDIRDGIGDDVVHAGGGKDRIQVGGSRVQEDTIDAGDGDDRIWTPDKSADFHIASIVTGGDGSDTLFSGSSRDEFDGGKGEDTIDYSARTDAVYVELFDGPVPQERLSRNLGENQPRYRNGYLFDDGREDYDETVLQPEPPLAFGEKADPSLERVKEFLVPAKTDFFGAGSLEGDRTSFVEVAIGGSGDDVFIGSHGRDILHGGDGRDTFFAGSGQDDLYGDGGNDLFLTADTRDASFVTNDERNPSEDLIRGGAGKDYARIDWRDQQSHSSVETVELLRYLTS